MPEEEMKIFCYRDNLEGEKYKYYGVTLYFVEGVKNIYKVKPERVQEVSAAIRRIVKANDPIIEFIRECIQKGTTKTRCYFDAKELGIAKRKQTQLALYEVIAQEKEQEVSGFEPEEAYAEILANDAFYEEVQDQFSEELSLYMGGMMYERSRLSECNAPKECEPGDFIFEIGRLQSARITYYGHYRHGVWLDINIFDEFDLNTLEAILNGNVETGHRQLSRQSTF